MKHRWLVLVILIGTVAAPLLAPGQLVRAESGKTGEPFPGEALCLPDAYLNLPGDCLPLGPSQTLTALAKKGLTFPPRPLPAVQPPSDLTKSPIQIAKINIDSTEPAQIYASLDDAASGSNPTRSIAAGAGLRYVSYVQEARVNGKPFVQLKSGEWMRASPAAPSSNFQGLLFQKTPTTSFGWIIDRIRAHSRPDYNSPEVGDVFAQNTVVQIYDTVTTDNMEWFMIGQDQWVPWQKSRPVHVDPTPPQGVTADRWIKVDLYNQVLTVYEKGQLIFATMVASGGEPFYTRPGLFKIYKKKPLETMSGAFAAGKTDYYYLEDVPWTMYFDQARALHGAYWRPWFGIPGTHGCVNLSLGDANWLYQWANEGDSVYVWDPSGKTPTDPKLYGEGGA